MLHMIGPVAGSRHDWYIYELRDFGGSLPAAFEYNGDPYCLNGNPEYNNRWFLDRTFQEANIFLD